MICAYATLCLLFYQGSWQLIFHPSRTVSATPAVPYQEIQFDYTETGKPQLAGWWIPAGSDAQLTPATPSSSCMTVKARSRTPSPSFRTLHTLGINVFAFDYRGFGKSADLHPSEASMNQDADAALVYIADTRHLPALFRRHLRSRSRSTRRHLIRCSSSGSRSPDPRKHQPRRITLCSLPTPARKSCQYACSPATASTPSKTLKTLQTPKLFLDRGNGPQTAKAFSIASTPKQLFQIAPEDRTKYLETMHRFLDEVLSHP